MSTLICIKMIDLIQYDTRRKLMVFYKVSRLTMVNDLSVQTEAIYLHKRAMQRQLDMCSRQVNQSKSSKLLLYYFGERDSGPCVYKGLLISFNDYYAFSSITISLLESLHTNTELKTSHEKTYLLLRKYRFLCMLFSCLGV